MMQTHHLRRLLAPLLFTLVALLSTLSVGCSDDATQDGENTPVHDAGDDTSQTDGAGEGDAGACAAEASEDCDDDGLLDCEEEQLGTDSCSRDTDGDGLMDMHEVLADTDPLEPDTDADGLDDGQEVELGLDPLAESTYDDGIIDSERWIVTACDDPQGAAVSYHTNASPGDWQLALPADFDNYTELAIAGANADNQQAAAVYSDEASQLAGAVVSGRAPAGAESPEDVHAEQAAALSSLGSTLDDVSGGTFQTHDLFEASIRRVRLTTDAPMSAEQVRNELVWGVGTFEEADVSGLSEPAGDEHTDFRVFLAVVLREQSDEPAQALTLMTVAPRQVYDSTQAAQFYADDLTNTTHLAQANTAVETRCDRFRPTSHPMADFYWVIDHTDSMSDDAERVADFAEQFVDELSEVGLDYRLGVTTMEQARAGRLRAEAGWHTDRQTFLDEVDAALSTGGPDDEAYGLEAARAGLEDMTDTDGELGANERLRPAAHVTTMFVSDKEAQSYVDASSEEERDQVLDDYVSFFTRKTVAFALVGDGEGCEEADGYAYRQVSAASGGDHQSICQADLDELIGDLLYTYSSSTGYTLPQTPVSSSIRMLLDGEEIPRSREDGFDYFAPTNSLAFFGDSRPSRGESGSEPQHIVVMYDVLVE